MSKKNRFKKKNKQKLQKKIQQFAPQESVEFADDDANNEISEEKTDRRPSTTDQSESIIDQASQKQILKDVQMIIITIVGLAILLTVVKILDLKTDYISNFGNWLYKIAHISTI